MVEKRHSKALQKLPQIKYDYVVNYNMYGLYPLDIKYIHNSLTNKNILIICIATD